MRPEDHGKRTDDLTRRRFLNATVGTVGLTGGADVAGVTRARETDPAATDAPTPEQSDRLLAEAAGTECCVGRSITGDGESERLSGSFTAVVDRFEDDRAVLVLGRAGETAGELVTGSEELPADGRHVDAILEVTLSEGVLVAVEYHPEDTDDRAESAQRRFDRLSGRPPDPDDTDER